MNGFLRHFRSGLAIAAVGWTCHFASGQTAPREETPVIKPPTDPVPAVDSSDTSSINVTLPKTEEIRSGRVLLEDTKQNAVDALPRPELADRPVLPAEVARKLREFQLQREAYLKERKAIQDRYRNASEAERTKIRERYKLLQAQWQNYTFDLRDEAVERAKILKDDVVPTHRRMIEQARETVRDVRDRKPGID